MSRKQSQIMDLEILNTKMHLAVALKIKNCWPQNTFIDGFSSFLETQRKKRMFSVPTP